MRVVAIVSILSLAVLTAATGASAQRAGPVCDPNHRVDEPAPQVVAPTTPVVRRARRPSVTPSTAPVATRPIVSPFGGMTESGLDNSRAPGTLSGDSVGDAFGYGGLGATGTGWGGGGTGEGDLGMGDIGSMGYGSGTGSGQGYGSGAGRGLRGRGTEGPTVRVAPPDAAGGVSPEAIRRVVQSNVRRIQRCYDVALRTNDGLHGRVGVRFVIMGDGSVTHAQIVSADDAMVNTGFNTCVTQVISTWRFPAPEGGGVVTVNYPFNFTHPQVLTPIPAPTRQRPARPVPSVRPATQQPAVVGPPASFSPRSTV